MIHCQTKHSPELIRILAMAFGNDYTPTTPPLVQPQARDPIINQLQGIQRCSPHDHSSISFNLTSISSRAHNATKDYRDLTSNVTTPLDAL